MFITLTKEQQDYLLHQPETGMGYQVIEATPFRSYEKNKYLVLNSETAIEMDGRQNLYIGMLMKEGVSATRFQTRDIILTNITVLNEREFRGIVNESKNENERGALDNPKEPANGDEMFTRLSAFDNDRRIDKVNKCLRPGSFTTTQEDYLKCKKDTDDPVERYALPSNDEIKFAFEIKPKRNDILQRGIVQPANEKRGGGKEAYFENGTSIGTFIQQHSY